MAQTSQGNFDIKYHHIEAPTCTDERWGKEHKSRKLINPYDEAATIFAEDIYRTRELELLASSDYLWTFKRKLDGQNMRVNWDGERVLWNGKSNAFNTSAEITEYMNATFLEEIFEEKFGREINVTLFGEGMGPKIQGNELGLEKYEFVLFDVLVNEVFLEPENIVKIAQYFNLHTPYDFMGLPDELSSYEYCKGNLDPLIDKVAKGDFSEWEGIVAEPEGGLRDRKGERIIAKIKNKDYYLPLKKAQENE